MNIPRRKDLLSIARSRREEIEFVLGNAAQFKALFKRRVKKVPTLRGRHVLTLFYEPSTRTLSSFEVAANRLSADVTNFSVSTSVWSRASRSSTRSRRWSRCRLIISSSATAPRACPA